MITKSLNEKKKGFEDGNFPEKDHSVEIYREIKKQV